MGAFTFPAVRSNSFNDITGTRAFVLDSSGNMSMTQSATLTAFNLELAGALQGYLGGPLVIISDVDMTNNQLTVNTITSTYFGAFGGSHTAYLGNDGSYAGEFSDGVNIVTLCDGVNALATS